MSSCLLVGVLHGMVGVQHTWRPQGIQVAFLIQLCSSLELRTQLAQEGDKGGNLLLELHASILQMINAHVGCRELQGVYTELIILQPHTYTLSFEPNSRNGA